MTAEQWRSIKSGNPDIATKTLLPEAIIEIIETASKHFQMITQNANIEVSEEAVLDNMGTILKETLKTDDQGHKDSTENSEQLFAKEVVLSVQSAQSADTKTSTKQNFRKWAHRSSKTSKQNYQFWWENN